MFDFSEKFRKIKILVKIVQNCDLSKSLESWKIPISQKAWFFFQNFQKKFILIKRT